MKTTTEKWLYGLGAATIGGGAQAIVSGLTGMGFAPDKFNFTNAAGVWHLLGLRFVNFVFSAILSAAFYLRQSPLPPVTDTQFISKLPTPPEPPKN